MGLIRGLARFLTLILKSHKRHVFLWVVVFFGFVVLLFPYQEALEYGAGLVSRATNQKLHMNFEQAGLSFYPLGLKLTKVSVKSPLRPGALEAESLVLVPVWREWALLKMALGLKLSKVFGDGEMDIMLSLGRGLSGEKGLKLRAKDVDVEPLCMLLACPVVLRGKLGVDVGAQVDMEDWAQSQISLRAKAQPLGMASGSLAGFRLPGLEFKTAQLGVVFKESRLDMSELALGEPADPLAVEARARVALSDKPQWSVGKYTVDMKIKAKHSIKEEPFIQLVLSFVDQFKTPQSGQDSYAFKMTGTGLSNPPQLAP